MFPKWVSKKVAIGRALLLLGQFGLGESTRNVKRQFRLTIHEWSTLISVQRIQNIENEKYHDK